MNIKYNVDHLCRYNVKKYEYNIGSKFVPIINTIDLEDEKIMRLCLFKIL
jgi:hypothetical protein